MQNIAQFIFQLFTVVLTFWSITNIKFTQNDQQYPNQIAVLKVLISIAIGYLVASFFINIASLIWQL